MQQLIDILHKKDCSLVVRAKTGEVTTYDKKGVRDLIWILDNDTDRLQQAQIADKVVGKAAAGLIIQGGIAEVYADVMSRLALPLLDASGIIYSYGELVDRIVIPAGDNRCPLERIVADAQTTVEVETMLRQHFQEMQTKQK
jgi:iron complex outermembrane receptor protein